MLYPLGGVLLAAGAPLGLLCARALAAGRAPSLDFVLDELLADPLGYSYAGVATAIVFGVAGFVIGRFEDRLEHLVQIDPLTELANRGRFTTVVEAEIKRAVRYESPLSLLLIDVDEFKHVNDTYGHAAGDAALRRIADCLRAHCRSSDVAARYGGDEFAVLLPGTPLADAERFAQRLRELLRGTTLGVQGAPPPTLSIGVAELRADDAAELHKLVRRADDALYTAKREGRDRTSLAGPPPAVG